MVRRLRPAFLLRLGSDARNSVWLIGEHGFRILAGILVGAWVARHLGPSSYGELAFALAYVSLFAAIARLGLDGIVVRMLVVQADRKPDILKAALCLRIGAGVLAALATCVSVFFFVEAPDERWFVAIISLGLILQASEVVDLSYQAAGTAHISARCRLWQLALSSIAKIALILMAAPVSAFVVVALADHALYAAALFMSTRRQAMFSSRQIDFRLCLELVRESLPLLFSGILVGVYMRLDQVIVRAMLGTEGIGQYAAVTNITEALYALPSLIAVVAFPGILAVRAADPVEFSRRVARLARNLLVAGVALAGLFSVLAGPIVSILYGQSFISAADALAIHVWTLVPVGYAAVFAKRLIADGRQSHMLWITAAALVANVTALILLVPRFELLGAVGASLVAQLVAVITYLAIDRDAAGEALRVVGLRRIGADTGNRE